MCPQPSAHKLYTTILLLMVSLCVWLPRATAAQARKVEVETQELIPQQLIERTLKGGEKHSYKVTVAAEELFQVRVEQKGVDVVLRLLAANGAELARMDTPNDKAGTETLTFVQRHSAECTLEVSSFDQKAEMGRYTIRREAPRAATAQDRRRVEIERIFLERMTAGLVAKAQELTVTGDAGGLRALLPEFESACRLFRESSFTLGEAVCLGEMANIHNLLADKRKALEYGNQALPLFQALGEKAAEAGALKNIGEAYAALGEPQKALDSFNQALSLFKATGITAVEALILNNIGFVYASLAERQKAMEYYGRALPLMRAANDKNGEAIVLTNMSEIYATLGERQKALDALNQALPQFKALGNQRGIAIALTDLGFVYLMSGERQKALDALNQALSLYKAFGTNEEYRVLMFIGIAHLAAGDLRQAIDTYNQALPMVKASGNKIDEAWVLSIMGVIHLAVGENQKAVDVLNQALAIFQAMNSTGAEAYPLTYIGVAYSYLGDKQQAVKYLAQALPLHRRLGDQKAEAITLLQLGVAYLDMGEIKKAFDYTNQALPLLKAIGETGGDLALLAGVGASHMVLADKENALSSLNQAALSLKAVGFRGKEAEALANIGFVYITSGEYQKALDYLNQALPIARATGSKRLEGVTLLGIGMAHFNLTQDDGPAHTYFEQALALAKATGDKQLQARAMTYLSLLEFNDERGDFSSIYGTLLITRAIGDKVQEAVTLMGAMMASDLSDNSEMAIFFGKQSVNRLQQLRQSAQGLDNTAQKFLLRNIKDAYQELAGLLIQEGRLAEAVQILNLYQDEQFFDFNRNPNDPIRQAVQTPREAALALRYEQSSETVGRIGGQLEDLKRRIGERQPSAQEAARLANFEAELKTASDIFLSVLKGIETEFAKPVDGQDKVAVVPEVVEMQTTLRELSATTKQKTVALYTLLKSDDFYLLLVTPDEIKSFNRSSSDVAGYTPIDSLLNATNLNRLIIEFYTVLQTPEREDPRRIGKKLYDIILKPAEPELMKIGAQTLLWSLDGRLRYVPMAALSPDGKSYLVEHYQNVVFTRAESRRMIRPVSPNWTGTGFGSSREQKVKLSADEQVSFPALPFVKVELQTIFGKNPGSNPILPGVIISDDRFTETAFYEAMKARRPVAHIASHFSFRPGDDSRSFLVLGDGKPLTLNKLKERVGLFDGIELLTLSACNTAVQREDADGREIDGFAELEQRLGAGAVMATLWPASVNSTPRLMGDFYRLRQHPAGTTKAEALRKAQLALLNNKPYAHPYYWAPFVLFGNWR